VDQTKSRAYQRATGLKSHSRLLSTTSISSAEAAQSKKVKVLGSRQRSRFRSFSNWLHGFSLFLIWIRRQMQGTISVSVRKSRAKPSRNQQEDNVQRCAGQKEASTSSWKLSITKNPQKFSRWEPRFPRRVLVGMPGTGKTLIRKPQRERRIAFLPHVGIDSSNVCRPSGRAGEGYFEQGGERSLFLFIDEQSRGADQGRWLRRWA